MRNKCAAAIGLFALLSMSAFAQDRGPSTPEERKQAVALAQALESDPLNSKAKDARQWLVVWIATVPDITVQVCGEFTPELMKSKKNYAAEIFTQSMFSSAAFVVEHPDQKDDLEAKYLAGLEGSLRAYESIRKAKPKVSWPGLDALIAKREAGQLEAYVHEKAPGCK